MFTIKHIKPNGDEALVSCHTFSAERRTDGFVQYMAFGENPQPNDYIATWCGDDGRGQAQQARTALNHHTIYVMNRFGATVATHHFDDPWFGDTHCAGVCQADPALGG